MENLHDASFYNPLSKYNYLTPQQRKKKREIQERKGFSTETSVTSRSQISKSTIKKSKQRRILKAKDKLHKRKLFGEDVVGSSPLKSTNSSGDASIHNKFFKNRSPDHLKKISKKETTYVKSFIKKSRLEFNTGKCALLPLLNTSCSSEENSLNSSIPDIENLHPENHILEASSHVSQQTKDVDGKCRPVRKELDKPSNIPETELSNSVQKTCDKSKVLMEIQESFMIDDDLHLGRNNNVPPEMRIGNHSLVQNNCSLVVTDTEQDTLNASPKFYPLFYKNHGKKDAFTSVKSPVVKRSFITKDTSKNGEQMIIDAGQKEFGTKQCKTCNMIYTIGQAEDENLHAKYHDKYLINLKFSGWKEERLIRYYDDGRVIRVTEEDKNFKLKKVKEILSIANRDLGFSTEYPVRPNINFYLFISNDKKVQGCLVAESIISASPVVSEEFSTPDGNKSIWKLGNWYASSETVSAICGINRIWVAQEYRRHKVASRLIDCMRESFIYGYVISLDQVAFTDPTPDGREFASKYTMTDNFLVYK